MAALLCLAGVVHRGAAAQLAVVDFENLPLGPHAAYFGADGAGGFVVEGARFNNVYVDLSQYGPTCCWDGWAYSNTRDVASVGPENQFSAFPGSGADGSSQYGIGYSGLDAGYGSAPQIELPEGAEPLSIAIANTAWAALAMRDGAPGFTPPFGGAAGGEDDWFLLTIYGVDAAAQRVAAVEHYLADYRFAQSSDDYIQPGWRAVDLTPLRGRGVRTLEFRLTSSDAIPEGPYAGILTPAYFAADNLAFSLPSGAVADLNRDGRVDRDDFALWEAGWGGFASGGAAPADGDATGDGRVDGRDLMAWQTQFGALGEIPAVTPVPEPGCGGLLLAMTLRRPRRRTAVSRPTPGKRPTDGCGRQSPAASPKQTDTASA